MLKQCVAGITLIIVLIWAPSAAGQSMPSGKWWKDPGIAKELDLTSQDVKRLDDLFVKSRRRMIEKRGRKRAVRVPDADRIQTTG